MPRYCGQKMESDQCVTDNNFKGGCAQHPLWPPGESQKNKILTVSLYFSWDLARCYKEKQSLAVGRQEQKLRLQKAQGLQQWKMLAHFQIPKQ